jgi:uracil phosphoribosyltransferase
LNGDVQWIKDYLIPRNFLRIQVNATAINGVDTSNLAAAAPRLLTAIGKCPMVEFVIQANEETSPLWKVIAEAAPQNASLLFDASCGTGKMMSSFPRPPKDTIRFGYAGGLGPESLREIVRSMRADPGLKGMQVTLDMESMLRSTVNGTDRFDLSKAWACAEILDSESWNDPTAPVLPTPQKSYPPNCHVSDHPLLVHKLTLLRDRSVPPREFRQLLRELTSHIGYEALTTLNLRERKNTITPLGAEVGPDGKQINDHVAIVPILRAGLGMVEPMLELLPNAVVHHIGMYRDKCTNRPIEYFSRLPRDQAAHVAIVLDPMLATGQTVNAVISKLKAWGAHRIILLGVLGSQQGLATVYKQHDDVDIHLAAVDDELTANGYITPGLGDAGDRLYGTPLASLTARDVTMPPPTRTPVFSPQRPDKGKNGVMPPLSLDGRKSPGPPTTPPPENGGPGHDPVTSVLGDIGSKNMDADEDNIPAAEVDNENSATSLTTHDSSFGSSPVRMKWGAERPLMRGPVVGTTRHGSQRNAIGAHSGGYSIYKALAVVSGGLDPEYYPRLGMTTPVAKIGPFARWHEEERIVTMDPYGHAISEAFGPWLKRGYDVRPTIAVTKAHIELPESKESLRLGRIKADGDVLTEDGQSFVTKAAIEPVWHLPGIAKRFEVTEQALREALFRETNSMYPELITRQDLKLFLPPIGGMTVYIWGDVEKIPDESFELTCRVHDECNGSDVFGSDICTCRPYLIHAIEESIKTAQRGGTGVVVYFRKEGRALGEVTKYLVYNMRKRQEGGDKASEYFNCTHSVAGVTDTRFQTLMPDVLHWLGVTRIHRFISMSDMKYNAIVASGIKIDERVEIPPEMVPKDAQVEITAKVFHGYHGGKRYKVDEAQMDTVKGREYSKELSYTNSVKEGGGAVNWNAK